MPDGFPTPARRWSALVGLSAVTFLLLADDTAVAVALPAVQRELQVGVDGLTWVVNAYTLAVASLTLLAGRLADRTGARRTFLLGLAVFLLGSLAAGLADTAALLIAARVVQGIGAALVAPSALALIALTFPPRQRGVAIGIWSGVSAAALGTGPLFGAVISDWLGWQWIFLLNVPLGAATWLIARLLLPPSRRAGSRGGFDLPGAVLSGVALAALVMGLSSRENATWAAPGILFAVSAGAAALFVAHERRAPDPLVDVRLFRDGPVAGANLVSVLSTAVMCSLFFFLALYLQTVAGLSALAAGATLLPLTLSTVVIAPVAGRLTDLVGGRILVVGGMLVLAAALLGLGTLGIGPGGAAPGLWLGLAGVGIGLARTPTTTAALTAGNGSTPGMAAGILNTSQATGLAIGVALMGAILGAFAPNAAFDRALDPAHHAAFLEGFTLALSLNAGIAAAAAVLAAILLGPRRPERGTGPAASGVGQENGARPDDRAVHRRRGRNEDRMAPSIHPRLPGRSR